MQDNLELVIISVCAAYEKHTTRYVSVYNNGKHLGYLLRDFTVTSEYIVDSSTKMSKGNYYSRHIEVLKEELESLYDKVVINTEERL